MESVGDLAFQRTLESASDPATAALRLDAIVDYALYALNVCDREGVDRLLDAVARNPNTSSKTLTRLAESHPQAVLDNPVLPLLALEGTWNDWTFKGLERLRCYAFNTGHRYYPTLAQVCRAEWRIFYKKRSTCDSTLCVTCNPVAAQVHLNIWQMTNARRNAQ